MDGDKHPSTPVHTDSWTAMNNEEPATWTGTRTRAHQCTLSDWLQNSDRSTMGNWFQDSARSTMGDWPTDSDKHTDMQVHTDGEKRPMHGDKQSKHTSAHCLVDSYNNMTRVVEE